jgi:hypothetical protein
MERSKRMAKRRARSHPLAASTANASRSGCEIQEWFVGKVVWRIQRRPGLAAAVSLPPKSGAAILPLVVERGNGAA